jgi:hypothetical protein
MSAGDIYIKTAEGTQEVSSRRIKLAPRLRTMLILTDGVTPAFLLKEEADKIGAPPDFLEQLSALGLVTKKASSAAATTRGAPGAGAAPATEAPAPADEFSKFRAAKDFMNVTIVDALGIKSFFFTLKLEKAATRADLAELSDAYITAIRKSMAEAEAEVLISRLENLLG